VPNPVPNPVPDIAIATGFTRQPFEKAIAFLRQKTAIPSTEWDQIWSEAQDYCFSVTGVTRADILADIQEAIAQALENGTPLSQFKKDFEAIATNKGWLPPTGVDTPWRLALIFNQNIRGAYAAGRSEQLDDPDILAARQYRLYRHRDSMQPRPAHLALDGKVFLAQDPIWQSIMPVNGFGCRCAVFALSDRDLERRGLSISEPPKETVLIRDRQTGRTQQVPAIDGQPIAEPGFTNNPGRGIKEQRDAVIEGAIARLPGNLQVKAREAIDANRSKAK